MDWSAVVLVALGALLTGAATLGAVIVQYVLARRDRAAVERREQIEAGGAALAPIATLLTNLDPDRLAINASELSLPELGDLRRRWQSTLRDPLAAFAFAHPSHAVRELATELDVHVEWVLARGVSLVQAVLAHRDFMEVHEMVRSHHQDALRLIDELHTTIHRGGQRTQTGTSETDKIAGGFYRGNKKPRLAGLL